MKGILKIKCHCNCVKYYWTRICLWNLTNQEEIGPLYPEKLRRFENDNVLNYSKYVDVGGGRQVL